ncbi:MAG: MBL fold metallo-hydrolase [Gammaproteobacteria bacterium]|nr:MAG: MBL fold metallo-hydrolase [Gammaproteobacteria bacterium]
MRFASLGSGSKGNATVVDCGSARFLLDCGFSIRETERRLERLGLKATDLSAVLVTHEHTDHVRGVLPLAKKHRLPVIMTAGTSKAVNPPENVSLKLIDSHSPFVYDDVEITPVSVPHDAREPVQYVFRHAGVTLGVLTDLGSVTPHVVEQFSRCDGLLLECNHDLEMLQDGSYPPSLKRRIASPWGHLNNEQSLALLDSIQTAQLQHLVLGHISQQNNALDIVRRVMRDMASRISSVHYARQDEGFSWLELVSSPETAGV